MHRVAAAMPILEAQLDEDRVNYFRGFADDPPLFVAEVVAAHVNGEIDLPAPVLRILVSTLSLSGAGLREEPLIESSPRQK